MDELDDLVGKIEGRLYRLNLTTSRGERVNPHNNYLDWLAMSLFRQWLSDATSPPPPPPLPRASQSRNGGHARNNTIQVTIAATHHTNQTVQQFHPSSTLSSSSSSGPVNTNPHLGRVFRTLGSSPSSYLGHDECKKFLKLTPELYSRDNLKKFEKRLDEMKSMARDVVRPLMRSGLLGEGTHVSYLVCTRVEERDFPWQE